MTPTAFVILGATGDLVRRKIAPALFHLHKQGKLPDGFRVVGFSRRDLADSSFREHIRAVIVSHAPAAEPNTISRFLERFSFVHGHFEDGEDYGHLQESLEAFDRAADEPSNRIFYFAIAPEFYESALRHLAASGLANLRRGTHAAWTRIIVEKPFGKDATSAERLDLLLGELFAEEEIYRIDHYLGKEMLQNILAFRFANTIFEDAWDARGIERIEIRILETLGVEDRGAFYDSLGALRDVGQNHALQMLAVIAMRHPESLGATAIRKRRAEILALLQPLAPEDVAAKTSRAQYAGYREIKGVEPDSKTETYFHINAELNDPRWQGVPFHLEAGKRLGAVRKEVVVTLRHPAPCLCPPKGGHHYRNRVVFSLEPEEAITIHFFAKKPGSGFAIEERTFDFALRREAKRAQYVEEYGRLLLDCLAGDQTLFLSTDEVRAMWRFIDPIVAAWRADAVPLGTYQPNTDEPVYAANGN